MKILKHTTMLTIGGHNMLIDKFETYIFNIAGLKSRSTRKNSLIYVKTLLFVNPFNILFSNKITCLP